MLGVLPDGEPQAARVMKSENINAAKQNVLIKRILWGRLIIARGRLIAAPTEGISQKKLPENVLGGFDNMDSIKTSAF